MPDDGARHKGWDSLPAPLTPADCDLSDFAGFMLEVGRLRQSKQWLIAKRKPEIGFYAMNLWMASWHKLPAASIEDDDDVLCDAAMCDTKKWARAKADVMRGWIKCADGRLYHPIVATKALEAWLDKLSTRKSSDAGNCKKYGREFDAEPHDVAIATAVAALFALDPTSRKATKFAHVRKRPASPPPPPQPPPTPLPPGDDRESQSSPPGSQEKGREGTLPTEVVVAVADGGDGAPTSGAIWLQRLTEVRLRFGACLDASPNANTAKHLKNLCEPHTGVPCDWERDVWPAIETVLGGYVRRGETVSSLGVVCGEAIRNRDRRLAGLPDPEANPQPKTTRGSHGGRRNSGSRIGAAMQLVDEIDRRERADFTGGGEEGKGDHLRIADGRKQS
jgi:hypothetical protein